MNTESTQSDRELLVAWLDGELTDPESLALEERLARDDELRTELRQLEQTWTLLDELPVRTPEVSFTRSTMELVVQDEVKNIRTRKKRFWTWPGRIMALLAVPLATFWIVFQFTNWQQHAPLRALAAELPLLTNFEIYESAGSIEFAQALSEQGLFRETTTFAPQNAQDATIAPDPIRSTWHTSVTDLQNMSPHDIAETRRRKARFEQLTKLEKDAFASFHARLMDRTDRDELLQSMKHYNDWLQEIDREQMLALQSLSIPERIEAIRTLQRHLQQRMFGRTIDGPDRELILQWFESLVEDNASEIQKQIRLARRKYPQLRFVRLGWSPDVLVRILMQHDPDAVVKLVRKDDFQKLVEQLSPGAREIVMNRQPEENRFKFVLLLNLQPWVSDAKLREFYYKKLTPREQAEFDNLSTDAMRERLIQKYFQDVNGITFPSRKRTSDRN